MPGFILYTINRLYPHVLVHITGKNVCLSQRRRPHQPVELSVPHLRCLRYLSSYWDGEWDELSKTFTSTSYQARLKDIICSSPNLETLNLFQTTEPSTTYRGIISLQKGDTMPQLKHLNLSNMHFNVSQSLLWAESLQWELLHSLSLLNGNWSNLAPLITGRLRNLKSLEVSISCYNPRMIDWPHYKHTRIFEPLPIYWERATQVRLLLESFSSLETFSGYYLPQYILDTLSSHHALLRHLRFRSANLQRNSRTQLPFPPSIEDLVSLPDRFPKLQSLGIDLDWENDEWFLESDSGCEPLSLRSLHIKMGEWESIKWSPRSFYHTMGPLIIGERQLSKKMHFYRFAPHLPRPNGFLMSHLPPKDDYRIILELQNLDSPFMRDSGPGGEDVWAVADVFVDTKFPDYRRHCAIRTLDGGCMLIPRKDEGLKIFQPVDEKNQEILDADRHRA
ncbi:hypothetical protein N7495_009259 [Penicillium taxi]|uniref:uncharacterized protein n=1 Tax=Penicillium taxi TaxID=168475 RepID=UPI0025450C60|nr:uncharacterized protein N7495_009259 [Penicillium taxi]KAJ5884749.1 hypothetical protein N7495_009259 [Penicillium taxi]